MAEGLYIDGKDALEEYGVRIVDGGYNDIANMPKLKSVTLNDWQEEDGVEADLTAPVLDTKDVQLKLSANNTQNRYYAFIETLSDGAYHEFEFRAIGRTRKLRLVSVSVSSLLRDLALLTMKFADDFPLDGYEYAEPLSTIAEDDSYAIDGKPTTAYNVRILSGTLAEVTRTPEVKTNMLRNIGTVAGAIYDPETVTYKSKDVKVYCLMTAEDTDTLWRNRDALLYDLTRPGERALWVDSLEQSFPFYYKSCAVSEFYCESKIWLRFTLTLTFTRDFRITDDDVVLATESGVTVFTQDDTSAIEMLEDKYTAQTETTTNNV